MRVPVHGYGKYWSDRGYFFIGVSMFCLKCFHELSAYMAGWFCGGCGARYAAAICGGLRELPEIAITHESDTAVESEAVNA